MTELRESDKPIDGRRRRRAGRSMFGPIVLITIGVYLLLENLDVLPDLNWGAALQLWPLLLIFTGLNIVVRQVPRPAGTILSLLVALIMVGVFSYALLFSDRETSIGGLHFPQTITPTTEQVSFPIEDLESAEISVDFSSPSAEVAALIDSTNLIEAEISFLGELVFESQVEDGRAKILLGTTTESDWLFWINPINWFGDENRDSWEIGLNPSVPTALTLDLSSGSVGLDLARLNLTGLEVDGASGSAVVTLSPGEYDVSYRVGSGSVAINLPQEGRLGIAVEGGVGSLSLAVPESMEARLTAESGSGSLSVSDNRFRLVSDEGDIQIWETAGYNDARWRTQLTIDVGLGSVSVGPA